MSSLQNFSGTLVLVGAGKMGGAMLEGWLALGLDPKKIAIREPQPSDEIKALAARGVRINPDAIGDASVIILAVKPQVAAEVVPPLKALVRAADRRGLGDGGQDHRSFSKARSAPTPRSCARSRTRPPQSGAASRSRCRMRA